MPLRCKVFARLNNCANGDEADVSFVQKKAKSLMPLDLGGILPQIKLEHDLCASQNYLHFFFKEIFLSILKQMF